MNRPCLLPNQEHILKDPFFQYLDDGISFRSNKATQIRNIYSPLSGSTSSCLKSAITPYLSGDIKIDTSSYLTKPTSTEDLRQNVRDFFVHIEGKGVCSFSQDVPESDSHVEVGQLWHKLVKRFVKFGIEIEALNFIPVSGANVELMSVTVKNVSIDPVKIDPTSSIPLFCRSLANKHDHENVTSLLNRIEQVDNGILVCPSMRFNEEGHLSNEITYFVLGFEEDGNSPVGSFPTVNSFLGDAGTQSKPSAVFDNLKPEKISNDQIQGKEAVGALRFSSFELASEESRTFYVMCGISDSADEALATLEQFNSTEKYSEALVEVKNFWKEKSSSVAFRTGDDDFNSWMHWVTIQPVLRRIFGNSYLPDHDYGKGGKGWRDIWQDLLSLILIEPEQVRNNLIDNFGGVRIDGSNATIIGNKPGEFIADRNAITRVWMDHGVWPFSTIALYIDQTGDFDILLKEMSYFRDPQLSRTFLKDEKWSPEQGNKLLDKSGNVYQGTVIEHILVQHLVQFFNVGEHNFTRLESADWNDGLDMAFDRGGERCFYEFLRR